MRSFVRSTPVEFAGTQTERKANHASHVWVVCDDGEVRCAECDVKDGWADSDYPCGEPAPRHLETVWYEPASEVRRSA